ncbi:MAG TPA: FxLYD domain-containing protein [Methylomirabilota bacterium]|nr:FxLYD domain-containing protein [Methylomirabilota bacterium]
MTSRAHARWVAVLAALIAIAAGVTAGAQETLRVTYEVDRTTRPGQARLNGLVVNEGSAEAVDVSVSAEAINSAGRVVARGVTYVDSRIARGDSRPFLVIVPNAAAAERFRVSATSVRGFSPQGP